MLLQDARREMGYSFRKGQDSGTCERRGHENQSRETRRTRKCHSRRHLEHGLQVKLPKRPGSRGGLGGELGGLHGAPQVADRAKAFQIRPVEEKAAF